MTSTAPLTAAAERNKGPILEVLRGVLPAEGLVLEIASGTGQHVAHFARALPALTWQPTDADPDMLALIAARIAEAMLENVSDPVALDVLDTPWPRTHADAVVCINMIHISPWDATLALFSGAGEILDRGGPLYLYGPFRRGTSHTAPSNAAFDESLRSRNPEWGVRDMEEVTLVAEDAGFTLDDVVKMPANNFSVVFRRLG